MKKTRVTHPVMKAQGDVLFVRIDSVPEGVKALKATRGRHILAEGETTGHAHAIAAKGVSAYADGAGLTYLTVEELAEVKHEEHGAIPLEPGNWLVKRQREMSVVDLMPRQVAD